MFGPVYSMVVTFQSLNMVRVVSHVTYLTFLAFSFVQIIMYLLSRTLFAFSRLAVEKGYIPEPKRDPFPLTAALIWGTILWLFEYHRHTLQPSLQSSMTYLYDDSNVWHDISDFLIYNKSSTEKWLADLQGLLNNDIFQKKGVNIFFLPHLTWSTFFINFCQANFPLVSWPKWCEWHDGLLLALDWVMRDSTESWTCAVIREEYFVIVWFKQVFSKETLFFLMLQ